MVQGLEGHSGAERRIADDADRVGCILFVGHTHREAEPEADTRARVAGVKEVVRGLVGVREAAQPIGASQRVEAILATGQDLVRIRLVRHVPNEAIAAEVEDAVQGDRHLDNAQIGAEMAACALDRIEQEIADFTA